FDSSTRFRIGGLAGKNQRTVNGPRENRCCIDAANADITVCAADIPVTTPVVPVNRLCKLFHPAPPHPERARKLSQDDVIYCSAFSKLQCGRPSAPCRYQLTVNGILGPPHVERPLRRVNERNVLRLVF